MKKLLLAGLVLTMFCLNVSSLNLPTRWNWDVYYIQQGEAAIIPGYPIPEAVCRLTGYTDFTVVSTASCNGISSLDTYEISYLMTSTCNGTNALARSGSTYTGDWVNAFFMTKNTSLTKENQMLMPASSGTIQGILACSTNYTKCTIGRNYMAKNYCFNETMWATASDSDKQLKYYWGHGRPVHYNSLYNNAGKFKYNRSISHENTYTYPILNYTGAFPNDPFNVNYIYNVKYFQNDSGLSDLEEYENITEEEPINDTEPVELNSSQKLILINITNVPQSYLNFLGETGIWDCDSGGNDGYYLPDDYFQHPYQDRRTLYQNLKDNCINVLNDGAPHDELFNDDGVDDNFTFEAVLTLNQNHTAEYNPQFIYYYDSSLSPAEGAYVGIDMLSNDNIMGYNLPWNKYTSGGTYEACFNFFDGKTGQPIEASDSYWSYSYSSESSSFKNGYSKLAVDAYNLYLESGDPDIYYKVYFTSDGYFNSEPIIRKFNTGRNCIPIRFNRNINENDSLLNLTAFAYMYALPVNKKIIGADLTVECIDYNKKTYLGPFTDYSSEDGMPVNNVLAPSICKLTVNIDKCIGKTQEIYVKNDTKSLNVITACDADFDPNGGGCDINNTNVSVNNGKFDLTFFVYKEGSLLLGFSGVEVTLSTPGEPDTKLITDSLGFNTFYKLYASKRYTLKVNEPGYEPFSSQFDGKIPFMIALKSNRKYSSIELRVKYNGTYIGGADVEVKNAKTGQLINGDGKTSSIAASLGSFFQTCTSGDELSFKVSYLSKSLTETITCPDGEGITKTIELTDQGGSDEISADIDANLNTAWLIIKIVLILFSILVLKRLGGEILRF